MIEEILTKIGLTLTEAKIYEVLLIKGILKGGEILKEARLNSGRIYDVLASLQNKGFISIIEENGVKKFKAAPPSMIQEYLKEQENTIKEKQIEVASIIPKLEILYKNQKSRVSIEVYTGSKGMRTSYDILFKEAIKDKKLYVTGITKQVNYNSWMPTLLKTFIYPMRKRLNLKIKKLMNAEAKKEKIWRTDNSEIKYISSTALTSYEVLGEVVLIQLFEEDSINIVIKSKQVAEDFREQFNALWKTARK